MQARREGKRTPARDTVFRDRLRRAIDQSDVTRLELCAAVGIVLKTLTNWLAGDSEPKAGQLTIVCRTLGVSADELLGLKRGRTKP